MSNIKIFTKPLLLAFIWLFAIASIAAETIPTPAPVAAKATSTPIEIGKVIITSGNDVKAIEKNKNVRELKRNSAIFSGDELVTGIDSRMEVRFADDATISLRPDTDLLIDKYKFNTKDPSENKNFQTLVKGGVRSLTGLMGKAEPKTYKLTTSVAIIGIRGTDYTAVLVTTDKEVKDAQGMVKKVKKDELYTAVWSGKTTVTNDAGQLVLGAGERFQNAMISSAKSMPVGLLQPASAITRCPDRAR